MLRSPGPTRWWMAGDATDVVSVLAADLPLTLDGKGATTLCVIVRATGLGGRVSRDAGPFCSP